jgi:hypothetical protein
VNLDKWKEVKDKILKNFEVLDQKTITDEDGHGIKEIIEFKSPLGEIRMEFSIRDLILDKHTTYSNRIGSDVKIDYEYSDTEKTYKLKTYKKVREEWEEIELEHQAFIS